MFYCFGAAGWIFLCVFRGERRNGNLIQLVVVGLFNDKCWEGGSLCLPPVAWLSVIWLKEILYKKLKVRAGRSPSQHVPFSGGSLSATSLPFLQQEIIPGLGQRPATAKPRGFAGFVSKSSSLLASFGIVVPFPKGFFFSGCFSPKKSRIWGKRGVCPECVECEGRGFSKVRAVDIGGIIHKEGPWLNIASPSQGVSSTFCSPTGLCFPSRLEFPG